MCVMSIATAPGARTAAASAAAATVMPPRARRLMRGMPTKVRATEPPCADCATGGRGAGRGYGSATMEVTPCRRHHAGLRVRMGVAILASLALMLVVAPAAPAQQVCLPPVIPCPEPPPPPPPPQ